MLSGIGFIFDWVMVAFWSAGLMFFVGFLGWGVSTLLDQPLARWIVAAVGMVALVCGYGWDVWFQSEPTSWIQHLESRGGHTHEQQIKLIWAAFVGGVAGLLIFNAAESWYSGRWRY
ncbi:hypothetical protein [Achromobacter piechaudii]|uniref:Transmembrane protein n=1 Tax=Achromobacter piechaudii TaxID=72556 RepID=A0A6S7DJS4_9BURK|nr:hypothetical protein [Achromobacter piechaudii]CAB3705150.1 hypothetical protein LMG1873_02890 [Achromobacter piechaudii]CAB3890281.1 hypothetical protein LMG1861_03765 [Achromobacter piechaudii]CAB3959696.1 hypothetical protein LMG6103_05889 [Achromobacter piechaudii]